MFSITILAVLLADSTFLRNLTGVGLPEDDKQAIEKVISNTQNTGWETDTTGTLDYFFENNELKAGFIGKTLSLKNQSESDLNFKTTVNKLFKELPSSFSLKLKGSEKDLVFNFSFYDSSWFKLKNAVFNISPNAVLSAKRIGSEDLGSQNYLKYEFELNPKIVFGTENNAQIKVEALVDTKKILFKKTKMDILFSGVKGRLSIRKEDIYSSYGLNKVIASPSTLSDVNFSQDIINYLLRDIKRKNDLRRIQAALEKYKEDNGKYPILITDSKDYNFLEPLKNGYLSDIPKDPGLVYYYRYEPVDGKDYTLTAVLENQDDKEGQKQGDFLLFKLNKLKKE